MKKMFNTHIKEKIATLLILGFFVFPLIPFDVSCTTNTALSIGADYLGLSMNAFMNESFTVYGQLYSGGGVLQLITSSNPSLDATQQINIGQYYCSINFTPSISTTISVISLGLRRYGGAGTETIAVTVRTDDGSNNPTSTTVGTGATTSKALTGSFAWYNFTVTVPVTGGVQYHIVAHQTTWDTTTNDGVMWCHDPTPPPGHSNYGNDPPTTDLNGRFSAKTYGTISSPIPGKTVFMDYSTGGAWNEVTSGVTNSSGYVSLPDDQPTNRTYTYRLRFLGDGTYTASVSSNQSVVVDYTKLIDTPSTIGWDYWSYDRQDSPVAPNMAGKAYSQLVNDFFILVGTKETGNKAGICVFNVTTCQVYNQTVLTGGTRAYPLCSDTLNIYVPDSGESGCFHIIRKSNWTVTTITPIGAGYGLGGVARDPNTGYIWSVISSPTLANVYGFIYFPQNSSYTTWTLTSAANGCSAYMFGFVWGGRYWIMAKKGNTGSRILAVNTSTKNATGWNLGIGSDYATSFPNAWVFDGERYAYMVHYNNGSIYKIDFQNVYSPVVSSKYNAVPVSGNGLNGVAYLTRWGLSYLVWTSHTHFDRIYVWNTSISFPSSLDGTAVKSYVVQSPEESSWGFINNVGAYCHEIWGARVIGGTFSDKAGSFNFPVPPEIPPIIIPEDILQIWWMILIAGLTCFFLPLGIIFYTRPDPATCIKLLMVSFIGFALLMSIGM